MTILKLTESTKKYFISSNLLSDDGIECPDDDIAGICALVANYPEFRKKLDSLSMQKLISVYNFFDEYCISKGLIKIIEATINNYELIKLIDKCKTCMFIEQSINEINCSHIRSNLLLKIYGYGISIFTTDKFKMCYDGEEYSCNVDDIDGNIIKYNIYDQSYELTFEMSSDKIVKIYDSYWGEFMVL
jgi:hypothetical protein